MNLYKQLNTARLLIALGKTVRLEDKMPGKAENWSVAFFVFRQIAVPIGFFLFCGGG
jgi:hypothetical protein